MEYGDHLLNNPIEHSFESRQFQVKGQVVARSFGKACLMNPYPDVAQVNARARKNTSGTVTRTHGRTLLSIRGPEISLEARAYLATIVPCAGSVTPCSFGS